MLQEHLIHDVAGVNLLSAYTTLFVVVTFLYFAEMYSVLWDAQINMLCRYTKETKKLNFYLETAGYLKLCQQEETVDLK